MAEDMVEYCIKAANGEVIPKAVLLNQDDFIPWKRGWVCKAASPNPSEGGA
jgi:altronate hydrolase